MNKPWTKVMVGMYSRREFLEQSIAAALVTTSMAGCTQLGSLTGKTSAGFDEFLDYDSLGLAELIKSGEVSQAEIVEIIVRRIEVMNPIINFMATPAFDRAREKAGAIPLNTPFAGVPVLMKDMVDIGGLRRTDGSRLMLNNTPEKNVLYVDAIENAGLNIIATTNVPEFASGLTTHNHIFGVTRNPWNLDYSTSVSSGGSAAAVAAGVIPMAHGTDGGGSNRLPASTCGVFGMKPSRYRMLSGEAGGAHDFTKTNQMLSRTVRDSAAVFNLTEDKSGEHYTAVGLIDKPLTRRLKIGFISDLPGSIPNDPAVDEAQVKTAELLESLGHKVEETHLPFTADQFTRAYGGLLKNNLSALKSMLETSTGVPITESGILGQYFAGFATWSASLTDEDVATANAFIESLTGVYAKLFEQYDILLTPVNPNASEKLSAWTPDTPFDPEHFVIEAEFGKYTGTCNFSGNPAMSVPLNNDTGLLPIGSQFIAKIGGDGLLYELALELEQAKPWKDSWAPNSLRFILDSIN